MRVGEERSGERRLESEKDGGVKEGTAGLGDRLMRTC